MTHIYDRMIVKKRLEPRLFEILARAEATATHPNSKRMIKRMRERYASFSSGLTRLTVAHIPELARDDDGFASVQWERPVVLSDFKVPPPTGIGVAVAPTGETRLQAAHDGQQLYLRVMAKDSELAQAVTVGGQGQPEVWPRGDHIELWFRNPRDTFCLAFNASGAWYDARNYDRAWDAGGRLQVRRDGTGYEAIVTLPLAALGLVAGEETALQWFCVREVQHRSQEPEVATYLGGVLYRVFYPIAMQ